MSESAAVFPFDQLWSQVRRKAWMWLFNRRQVEAGMAVKEGEIQVVKARMAGCRELEISGAVASGVHQAHQPVLMLKAPEGGELVVLTQCTCSTGALCKHAAAMLFLLNTAKAQTLVEGLAKSGGAGGATEEVHAAPQVVRISGDQPHPILRLSRRNFETAEVKMGRGSLARKAVSVGVAEPLVIYEGCAELFPMLMRKAAYTWQDGSGRTWELSRNVGLERLFAADLMQAGLVELAEAVPELAIAAGARPVLAVPLQRQALFWAQFLQDTVPQLRSEGWTVEVANDFGFAVHAVSEEAWFADLVVELDDQEDYGLDLGIDLHGQRLSLVPLLVECIDQGLTPAMLEENLDQKFLLALPGEGNPVLALPARRLLVLLRFFDELLVARAASKSGSVRLDKLRAAQLQNLDGLPINAPAEIAALRARLAHFDELTAVSPPAGLRVQLRPYQLEGVTWLQFLREFGLHGVLADDMGLGKTLQTLAHLLMEKEAGRMDRPCLIVAPTSLLRNWGREAAKFTPELRILLLHGDERHSDFWRIGRHDLVITSYPLLVRDAEPLAKQAWHVVALDEAQNIKNPKSKVAQAAGTLQARHRLCLTGTPMENHLGELWSLFHFLMPGYLGDAETFRHFYRHPIERDQDQERQQQLASRLRPLLLRRTKGAVAKDLPPKTEILHTIELGQEQTDLYETIRAVVDKRVREAISAQGLDRSQIVVLDALLKLRQVCCHPKLVKAETARRVTESAKTDYLMEDLLPELLEEGHRVLIFSQFTEMLAILEGKLKGIGAPYVILTGATKDRETPVQRFQRGEVPVFLISLKAGGSGLNLTTADAVIHYDPWWNPAAEAQASDRAHRIGQTKPVFIHKLICQGTIEERIVEMQKTKAALIEGLLTGRAEQLRLTPEDLKHLLEA